MRADEAAATRHFAAGRAAFEARNYEVALREFEAAAAAGLSGPAVQFNIGVAAYRLERYSRAEQAFKEVARTPAMGALAHYNLGLVAVRRGQNRMAAQWFSRAGQESSDPKLRDLAAARLRELPVERSERNWAGYAALGAGSDDNVALVSNADVLGVSGREDSFTELQLAVGAPLGQPWQLDAGLFWTDYHDLDMFDLLSVQGGGRYRLSGGEWRNELGVQAAHTTLDGTGFENRQTLILQSGRVLRESWRWRGQYRFSNLKGLNDFRGLSGLRHEVNARIGWTREPWNIAFDYRFDINDYDDEALSTQRHELSFEFQRALAAEWSIALEAARRHSEYDLTDNGTEDRTELALGLAKSFGTRWRFVTRYAYADNEADLPEFNYRRSRFSASLEAAL